MTRSSVVKRIERYLYKYRGCHFGHKECSELLAIIEKCEPTLYNSWDWYIYKCTNKRRKSTRPVKIRG